MRSLPIAASPSCNGAGYAQPQGAVHQPVRWVLTPPGGVGTMDEPWEAISWAQLGYHAKPVGVLNFVGFYEPLPPSRATWRRAASSGRSMPGSIADVFARIDGCDGTP